MSLSKTQLCLTKELAKSLMAQNRSRIEVEQTHKQSDMADVWLIIDTTDQSFFIGFRAVLIEEIKGIQYEDVAARDGDTERNYYSDMSFIDTVEDYEVEDFILDNIKDALVEIIEI